MKRRTGKVILYLPVTPRKTLYGKPDKESSCTNKTPGKKTDYGGGSGGGEGKREGSRGTENVNHFRLSLRARCKRAVVVLRRRVDGWTIACGKNQSRCSRGWERQSLAKQVRKGVVGKGKRWRIRTTPLPASCPDCDAQSPAAHHA